MLFDPENRQQAKLALKLAGVRTRKELSPERKAALTTFATRALRAGVDLRTVQM